MVHGIVVWSGNAVDVGKFVWRGCLCSAVSLVGLCCFCSSYLCRLAGTGRGIPYRCVEGNARGLRGV